LLIVLANSPEKREEKPQKQVGGGGGQVDISSRSCPAVAEHGGGRAASGKGSFAEEAAREGLRVESPRGDVHERTAERRERRDGDGYGLTDESDERVRAFILFDTSVYLKEPRIASRPHVPHPTWIFFFLRINPH
jgi:hypothetical protein